MFLVFSLRLLHLSLVAFVLSAWMFPWETALTVHLILVPLLIIHWKTNQNRCVLTELEERWIHEHWPSEAQRRAQTPPPSGDFFTKRLMRRILCGHELSDRALLNLIYGVMWIGWLASAARLWH